MRATSVAGSEATARIAYLPPDQLLARPDSVGRAVPGVTLRITDEHGVELPVGEVGEIRVRGANVTHGYWQDPVASAEKFVDGELRTGDLGRLDHDGFLHVVDRIKEVVRAKNVARRSHTAQIGGSAGEGGI